MPLLGIILAFILIGSAVQTYSDNLCFSMVIVAPCGTLGKCKRMKRKTETESGDRNAEIRKYLSELFQELPFAHA